MHRKGLLFAPDDTSTQKILARDTESPHSGPPEHWPPNTRLRRFCTNPKLKEQLLATGSRGLVETSPRDQIWSVGFGAKNAGNGGRIGR
ncbi:hypothetical protein PAAG_07911 [Paracoccidioides lutzii Pb01]|uniref:NADAR domain-containing protein n=1 Tax=Paracoccidioides lutzii (strain ATCC MYA-826 / Pb01) TaxID=502779 RepID=C1HAT2_PARBA|nr:hypothetical protein PAAG_07911 [Paracoccidioides lutzii Pb01]EEH37493.2 hypothetical protein PAAG_07911 [Paracoccidioides lutzii Pb01]